MPLHKMTTIETAISVTFWLVFFGIIAAGDVGIYLGVASTGKFDTPTIFGFMAAYSVFAVIFMCVCVGYIVPCINRIPHACDVDDKPLVINV